MNQALDKDTLELIQKTAVAASQANGKVQIVKVDGWDDTAILVKADGTYEEMELPPRRRTHGLAEVAQVGPYCVYMHELLQLPTDAESFVRQEHLPVVWYSEGRVVVVCDDSERRDFAQCDLTKTDQFKRLAALASEPEEMTQAEFVRLLKYDLHDGVPESLIRSARKVKFTTGEEGFGDVGRGKTSLGREMRAEINTDNGIEFPDEVTINCRVFTDLGLKRLAKIKCDLDVDAQTQMFSLRPYPGEIEREIDEELAHIGTLLATAIGDTARLFRGTP